MTSRVSKDGNPLGGEKLGAALHVLRVRMGLTLSDLSDRTGLPISTLSKLENDKMSFSYDKLVRLAAGMGVDIAEIIACSERTGEFGGNTGRRSVAGPGHSRRIETSNYVHIYLAADVLKKRFVPIYGEVRARSIEEFGELIRHPGEEFVYVLEGAIEVHTELYAPTRLEVGESMYFDSVMAHAYIAAAPGRCAMLSICSAEESQLIGALPAALNSSTPSPTKRNDTHKLKAAGGRHEVDSKAISRG